MPTAEVIATANQVQAHLDRAALAGVGPIDLGPDVGLVADAARRRRSCWPTSDHCKSDEWGGKRHVPAAAWAEMPDTLRRVLRAASR